MADPKDPLAPDPDPTEDTPDEETEDTAEDDAGAQSDWTPKDRAEATRKITELSQQNAQLRREAEQGPDDDADDADDEAEPPGDIGYLDDQNALLAAELYGEQVTQAAQSVWPLLETANTTADWMAVLESYHKARSEGAPAPDAAAAAGGTTNGAPTRQEAVQPRVDTNRSDGSPGSDDKIAEAKASGKLGDFATAAAEALGFGPKR